MLRSWSTLQNGFIPYVWGGCSFAKAYTERDINKKTVKVERNKRVTVFKNKKSTNIETGFDCTGMVARAAQMSNIPYFFKNSFTATENLCSIDNYENLKNGDLIYFNGHVAVVSDIKRQLMIEARGHESGFGKVQEIKLSKSFNNIKTYKDLFDFYQKKKPLERLDINGKVVETAGNLKLLRLF